MTVTVYMLDGRGGELGGYVTEGATLFEAVRQAWAWFEDPHWLGQRPSRDTVFRVRSVADPQQVWYVRAGRALDATVPRQRALLDVAPDAF